jgi:phosphoglycerate dehydrogenase-like enzyme
VDHFLKPGILGLQTVLTNSSGAYGVTIAEHVVMVTLEMLRRKAEYNEAVRQRKWIRNLHIESIRGSRILMMGTGDIGQEAALRLRAFSPASLLGLNRSGRNPAQRFDRILLPEDLEKVLPETDLLILSLPDTPETRGVLDQKRLALLPDGAVIVNVGRGSAIHQGALEKELRAGRLSAALDVFEKEPLPQQDPMWDCPNLLLTPHVAGNMTLPYTLERIVELFLEDFENYCAGRPLCRAVNPQKGY